MKTFLATQTLHADDPLRSQTTWMVVLAASNFEALEAFRRFAEPEAKVELDYMSPNAAYVQSLRLEAGIVQPYWYTSK